jgi:protein-disulfide isomerase
MPEVPAKKGFAVLVDVATLVAALAIILAVVDSLLRSPVDPLVRDDVKVVNWDELVTGGHSAGPAEASLTIVVFGDFECPACRAFHRTLSEFSRAHEGAVRLVYRHFPLPQHPGAYDASVAAVCAGFQGVFWPFYHRLYTSRLSTPDEHLEAARDIGVSDLPAFRQCLGSDAAVTVVEQDLVLAREVGAWGTPTVIANGILLGRIPDRASLELLLGGDV